MTVYQILEKSGARLEKMEKILKRLFKEYDLEIGQSIQQSTK